MRIKHLFYFLLALPLFFVACEENTPVDEVKNPTLELTAGETTEFTLSFTIATTEATDVAWLAIEATEATPTASEVLANGAKVEVNKSVECKAIELKDGTEYTIVAAVKNSKAVEKKEIKMTTIATTEDTTQFKRISEAEVEFTADGGKGEIEYEIINPIEGTEVDANTDAEWITLVIGEKIAFTVAANTKEEPREDKITVSYGALKFEVKVKQAAKEPGDEPVEGEVNFTAAVYEVFYYDTQYSAAYNYMVYLSDNGLNENGHYKQDGVYYMFDIYAADSAENNSFTLPNGKYTASDTSNAGTFGIGNYGACIKVVDGVPTYSMYKQGTVTVTDGKIEAKIMMEDGTIHNVSFEGNLRFDGKEDNPDNPDDPDQPADVELTATTWTWGGATSWGNKYSASGEGFSVDVHFPAEYASESALEVGDYIWTNTSWWGYNDFDNEFTTRSFLVDGAYTSIIKEGTAVVALEGDVYDIKLKLKAEDGTTYSVSYNGKLADEQQGGGDEEGDEVVFTKMESLGYNSSYYFYEFKLTNDAGDSMQLCVNDYQSKEGFIYTDNTYEWISIGYCGNLGYFSTRNINVDGTSYTASSGSMEVVTDESTYHMDLTVKLLMTAGGTKTFKFSGKVGEDNGGNEGGETPAEPTKLETPSVAGLVSGNAATVSWQAVAGAANYTVTLNGTDVQTVTDTYIVYSDLAYSTTYTVSVVANPADTAANTASDAGTATFTTEADPNAGGDEGGNEGGETTESFENWTFSATLDMGARLVTVTDGSHTVTFTLNAIAGGTFYINDNGALNAYDVTVNGVAAESASGTLEMSSSNNYHIVLDAVINGVKYTGTSTNAVV